MARPVRENCTHLSCRTKTPKYALLPVLSYIPSSFQNTQPTPLPCLTSPTPEQAFLAKTYNENARRADRDHRGIFYTPTDACVPAAGLALALPLVKHALAEKDGVGTCAMLGSPVLGKLAGAPTSSFVGSGASPIAADGEPHATVPGTLDHGASAGDPRVSEETADEPGCGKWDGR